MANFGFYWENWYPTPAEGVAEITVMVVCFVLATILLIKSLYSVYIVPCMLQNPGLSSRLKSSERAVSIPVTPTTPTSPATPVSMSDSSNMQNIDHKVEKMLQLHWGSKLLMILSMALSITWLAFALLIETVFIVFFNIPIDCGVRGIFVAFILMSRASLLSFYVLRVYLTFKGSVYEMNKVRVFVFTTCYVSVWFVGSMLYVWTRFEFTSITDINFECEAVEAGVIVGVLYVLDVAANIGTAAFFWWKLKQVERNTNDDVDTSVLEQLAKKLSLLMIVQVIFTVLSLVFVLVSDMEYAGPSADLLVSNLTLWLSFAFNSKSYRRFCKYCIKLM